MSRGPKETVYDEQIAPLLSQIDRICEEHRINFIARAFLDADNGHTLEAARLFCYDGNDVHGRRVLEEAARDAKRGEVQEYQFTPKGEFDAPKGSN